MCIFYSFADSLQVFEKYYFELGLTAVKAIRTITRWVVLMSKLLIPRIYCKEHLS